MIIVRGVGAAVAALDVKIVQMRAATATATRKALSLIERNTKQKLRTYTHREGEPTNSPPGEPPAWVTGTLARSVSGEGPTLIGTATWRGRVGPTAVYGRIQELGGTAGPGGHSVLPARPYLQPTFDDALPDIERIFREAWTAAILA